MKHRRLLIGLTVLVFALISQFVIASEMRAQRSQATTFVVRVENISNADGQTAADGSRWPFAMSPGMFVLSEKRGLLFTEGKRASKGLEMQAEDGKPDGLVSSLEMMHHAGALHGVFNTPVGTTGPGPIGPGGAFEFNFKATSKTKLQMTLMFGQSNDLFYAPEAAGIALFDGKGSPISGDITDKLILWDAGTEVNEEPGVGPNQAPRQAGPNTGANENGVVHRAKDVRFYGMNTKLFRVTITPLNGM
jgi:hypothetical protein